MIKNRLIIGVVHVKKALIGIILLTLFTQCAFFAATPNIPPSRFCTTVGAIIGRDFSVKGKPYIKYEYYVGNKKYQGLSVEYLSWAPNGEKYLLIYDSLYPEDQKNVHLITDYPVFLPEEVTNYTVGKITDILITKRKHLVTFDYEYTLLGKTYQRIQFLEGSNPLINYPQLSNGAEFLVEYWVENPQRAIIYIDKPKTYIDTKGDSMLVPDIHVLRPTWYSTPVVLPDSALTKHQSGW